MTLYNYKRFLGDSDKIVQKYFNLKEEVKKREIFRKIGLDKYFQPVTSVIRQEIKPFHNLIKNQPAGNNEERVDKERYEEDNDTWGSKSEDERDIEEGAEAEDKWGSESEEKDKDDDCPEEEELPGYGESLGFSNFHKLYSVYPDEKRNTDEFLNAYKATLKKNYNYEENRDDFSGLSLEDLKEKEYELKKIYHSANNLNKYNKKINKIIEDVQNQKEEVDKRKNLILRIEHDKEKITRKKKSKKEKEKEEKKT